MTNSLGMDHQCDRRMDRQTDKTAIAIALNCDSNGVHLTTCQKLVNFHQNVKEWRQRQQKFRHFSQRD